MYGKNKNFLQTISDVQEFPGKTAEEEHCQYQQKFTGNNIYTWKISGAENDILSLFSQRVRQLWLRIQCLNKCLYKNPRSSQRLCTHILHGISITVNRRFRSSRLIPCPQSKCRNPFQVKRCAIRIG